MHNLNLDQSVSGPASKRKRSGGSRANARRQRETLFFSMLVEDEFGATESAPSGAGVAAGGLLPAWLHMALGN